MAAAESAVAVINKGQWPEYNAYTRLDSTRHEIRLLALGEGDISMPLACTLSHTSLDDKPEFCALSYYWGAPVSRCRLRTILVNGDEILIRPTLEMFLRNLTLHAGNVHVWLDAICINQKDVIERGQQVSMMGEIYRSARMTYVWLGEGNADTDYACDYISNKKVAGVLEPRLMEGYVEQLFWRPYWRRLWIVQEFVLSKQIRLLVGSKVISLDQLDRVVEELYSSWHERQQHLAAIPTQGLLNLNHESRDTSTNVSRVHSRGSSRTASRDVSVAPNLHSSRSYLRQALGYGNKDESSDESVDETFGATTAANEDDTFAPNVWQTYFRISNARKDSSIAGRSLLELVNRFRDHLCIDDLDRVYALLSLANDRFIQPDYSISTSELYFRMLAQLKPPCDTKLIDKCGHEIFNSGLVGRLICLCIPLNKADFYQCFESSTCHEFSQFFDFVGKISQVEDVGFHDTDWNIPNMVLPMRSRYAWVGLVKDHDTDDKRFRHADFSISPLVYRAKARGSEHIAHISEWSQ